jgi:hypothetical protein
VNTSRLEVNDEEHQVADQTAKGEDLDAEEVRCGDRSPVRLEEGLPGQGLSSDRRRLNASLFEDALNGRSPQVMAHVAERATKARIPPRRVLSRHRQQLFEPLIPRTWPTGPTPRRGSVVLGRHPLAVPAQNGFRRGQRRDLGQPLSSERFAADGEQPALGVAEPQTLGAKARSKHAVFSLKVLERLCLVATQPARDQQDEKVKRRGGHRVASTILCRVGVKTG